MSRQHLAHHRQVAPDGRTRRSRGHNADYGNLVWLAWTAGLSTRVDTWGPPPLEHMTRAQAAGVKTLVLSHLVPSDDPAVTEQQWIDAAQLHFRGTVTLGKDLLEV